MRTIRTKVYQFSELSKEAQQKAIEKYRNSDADNNQHHYDEVINSVKAAVDLFDLKTGREYTDIRCSHIDDNILQFSGVRLYKYILNNYGTALFTPKYIKCIDRVVNWRPFICEVFTGNNGKYTMIYSRNKKDNSCPLTGVCYDMDILQPVYDFLKWPDNRTTFESLISEIETAIQKTFSDTEQWINSADYITEEIEANEYEFTADGNRFHS